MKMFNLGFKPGFEEKMDGTGYTFPRAVSQQSAEGASLYVFNSGTVTAHHSLRTVAGKDTGDL